MPSTGETPAKWQGFFYAQNFQLFALGFPAGKARDTITTFLRSGERRRRAPSLGLRAVFREPPRVLGDVTTGFVGSNP